MSNKGPVRFTPALTDQARRLLLGLNPTPARVAGLLSELETRRATPPEVHMETPDPDILRDRQEDEALGRQPVRRLSVAPEDAAARLAAAQSRRPPVLEDGAGAAQPIGDDAARTTTGLEIGATGTHLESEHVVSDEAIDKLRAEIAAGAFRGHMETVERKAIARLPGAMRASTRAGSLDDAARMLLAEMQPNHQDAVQRTSEDLGWPLWAVILGAVAHVADLQELAGGNVEAHWIDGTRPGTSSRRTAPSTCIRCLAEIPDARPGQQACCNLHGSGKDEHSEGCRLKHRLRVKGEWVDIPQLKD